MQEDAPVNSVAGGGVKGIGGSTGEPGFTKPVIDKYKKGNMKNAPSPLKIARRMSFKEFITR